MGYFFFCFLEPHPRYMEILSPGLELELHLAACATATAMQDLSHVCDLYHSSQHCRIPDPLSEARDRTCILLDTSWIWFHCATVGTPWLAIWISAFLKEAGRSTSDNWVYFWAAPGSSTINCYVVVRSPGPSSNLFNFILKILILFVFLPCS